MPTLRGSDGSVYETNRELARGGEGVIVEIRGRPDLLAKLYLPGQANAERFAKLRAMLADPPRDEMRLSEFKHPSIAWPLAGLNEGRRFAGFVMPRIHGGHALFNAYLVPPRGALDLDWRARHQVAKNLCIALNALHAKGYVMGDINERNILVNAQGLVTLVDTDSYQVRAGPVVHRCTVGMPEYTPPELHGQRFDRVDRSPEHDRFGLAVLVFKLLMDGRHPFAGVPTDLQRSYGKVDEWCIKSGIFPWSRNAHFRKPPAARALDSLDPRLAALFVRCFVSGHSAPAARPMPSEWIDALDRARVRLERCASGRHWRYPEGGECHLCRRAASVKARPAVGKVRTHQPPVESRPQPIRPRPTVKPAPPVPVTTPSPTPVRTQSTSQDKVRSWGAYLFGYGFPAALFGDVAWMATGSDLAFQVNNVVFGISALYLLVLRLRK